MGQHESVSTTYRCSTCVVLYSMYVHTVAVHVWYCTMCMYILLQYMCGIVQYVHACVYFIRVQYMRMGTLPCITVVRMYKSMCVCVCV